MNTTVIKITKYVSILLLCYLSHEYALHSTYTIFGIIIAVWIAFITFDIKDINFPKSHPDQKLVNKLINDIPPLSRGIEYLRNGPSSSYSSDDTSTLDKFLREWQTPGHDFVGRNLEEKKQAFIKALNIFIRTLYKFSAPHPSRDGTFTLKRGDDDFQRQRQEQEELLALISEAFEKYDELMKAAHKLT